MKEQNASFSLEEKRKTFNMLSDESRKLLNKSFTDKEVANSKRLIDDIVFSLSKEINPPSRAIDKEEALKRGAGL
jgi:hypothetical protein